MIIAAALVMRLLAWGVAERRTDADQPFVVAGDAEGYWDLSGDLVDGREYAVHEPPRRVLRTPGLPLVLAALRLLTGDSLTATRGGLAVLSVLGVVGVFALGRELCDAPTGMVAAALAAVSPLIVAFSPLVLSESLFGVALVWQMVWLARLLARGRRRDAAGVGMLGATAGLIRPAWCPLMAVIVLVVVVASRSRWRAGLVNAVLVTLGFAAVWTPWVVRNWRAVGEPVLTTLWTGPTLYDSVGPQADGSSDMTFFDTGDHRGLSEAEVNRRYMRRSLAAMGDDPARIVRLAVAKQARYWQLFPTAADAGPAWLRWPIGLWTAAFLGLALVGACVADWRTRLVAALPLLGLAAVHLVFVASLRYRVPAELPLCVLAAAGARRLWQMTTWPRS